MFSDELSIRVEGLSKCYQIYDAPRDRLKQFLIPRIRQMAGATPKQYFREFWALRDISFQIQRGEAFGIIGKNGSGKSTLLQIICGTLSPTSGTVETSGRIAALLELGAGFNPEFSGRDNVYMNAALLGLSSDQIDQRFDDIAAFADIGDFLERPVKMYSSGMFVRLAFAVMAHVDADVLVIDEALAVGDALFTQKCMRFIRQFRESHSLIFVSHDTSSVMNLCDQAIWLSRGRVQKCGPSKTVCDTYMDALFESLEDKNRNPHEVHSEGTQLRRLGSAELDWRDQRADIVNQSNLRNDLELFRFKDTGDAAFGGIDAKIVNVLLLDSQGRALTWVVGGELVCLRIEATTSINLRSPIFGFMVKDHLGQSLFGDNTYLSYQDRPHTVSVDEPLWAEFEFHIPWLSSGDYVIQVALAEGTQDSHRQLHWIHDALVFRSHHSAVSTGIMGIPMKDIRLSGQPQVAQ